MSDERGLFPNRAEIGLDGSVRKAHYGDGRQPWDDIKFAGWAPEFAAGCVLRYMRRTKDREHSIESARWYWERLQEMGMQDSGQARKVCVQLNMILTDDEKMILIGLGK